MGMMECKRQGVHKLFSSNGTKQAYSKFNFPSNMPIRLATTLRKDCFYNPDICVVFMEQENCSHMGSTNLPPTICSRRRKLTSLKEQVSLQNTQRELFEKRKILYALKFEQCQFLSSISVLDTIFFDNMFEYYCTGQLLSGVYSGIKEQVLFKLFSFYTVFLKPLYGNTSLTAHTNNELTSVHIQTSILEYFLIIEAMEKATHCVEFPWQALSKYLALR